VVGRAFLGLTLACARCHDHKFDPISTEDYYGLAGIFFSTRLIPGPVKGNTPLVRVPLLPKAEIAAIEEGLVRDAARQAELAREIRLVGRREYLDYIERQVASESERYLLAAWDFLHPAPGITPPAAAEFAAAHRLDPRPFARWVTYFKEEKAHPALSELRRAADKNALMQQARDLAERLSAQIDKRRTAKSGDATAQLLAESALLHFRADDRRLTPKEANQVSLWPNRAVGPQSALPVAETAAPVLASVMIEGQPRSVLRFSGKELLQSAESVPPVGSLFVVYRPDPTGPAGQRLIGWEDAAAGQHGLGLMTDGAGALHAILRRKGANADVVVPAPKRLNPPNNASPDGFHIVIITWGAEGVSVFRQGELVGTNKSIDAVSSDPAINALRFGGPGSGSSPRFQGDLAEIRVYTLPLDAQARTRVEAELIKRWCAAPESLPETSADADPIADLADELVSAQSPFSLEPAERDKVLPADFQIRLLGLREELEGLKQKPPKEIPRAVVVQEGGPPETPHEGFRDAQVYVRGNHAKPGKTVSRGVPKVIAGSHPPSIKEGSGRRELARWLASPENPLTARVMVNRIWQHHLGVGLVPTSANFGAMGERPSHPELLDFLAESFVASGWSMKAMHRLIMLSSVYQQSSAASVAGLAADPENRMLWRAHRRRLAAEELRDSLLAVAGRLQTTPGGPGFQDVATPRRSLYLMAVRTGAKTAEFGPLFDAPDCSGIVERRNESIVAPQALFFLNDPLLADLATSLATRVARDVTAGDIRERINRLYEIALGRLPTDDEIQIGLAFLSEKSHLAQELQNETWIGYCRLIVSTNEFMYLD
jgi:Protein of unknown function (DUF1553)/Protein of unknown function (DUF1549)/Concanavalin A-like lectin/glucanases superfamily